MSLRKDLSLAEKRNIIESFDSLQPCGQRQAANILRISQPTLCRLLKHREEIFSEFLKSNPERKRIRIGKSANVEEALYDWFKMAVLMNTRISRGILISKAEELAKQFGEHDFQATDGWLTRWKERKNISSKKAPLSLCELTGDTENTSVKKWTSALPIITDEYSPDHIFNMDEITLYYRTLPEHVAMFKTGSVAAKMEDMVTVLLACNMTGTTKQTPLIVGTTKHPKSFRGVKLLPVQYESTKDGQITRDIFKSYLSEWDKQLHEKILLILDNSEAHCASSVSLQNIRLVFLPDNAPDYIQPLHQGIIETFKTLYRKNISMRFNTTMSVKDSSTKDVTRNISTLDAMHMIASAWNEVSQCCVLNSFKRVGFLKVNIVGTSELISEIKDEFYEKFSEWVNIETICIKEGTVKDVEMEGKHNNDESDEELVPVTSKEALNALSVIRKALEQNGTSREHFDHFYEMERNVIKLMSGNIKQNS